MTGSEAQALSRRAHDLVAVARGLRAAMKLAEASGLAAAFPGLYFTERTVRWLCADAGALRKQLVDDGRHVTSGQLPVWDARRRTAIRS